MENLKIKVNTPEESKEAQELFFELGATLGNGDHHAVIVPVAIGLAVIDGLINFVFSVIVHSDIARAREITLPQLRDMVVLHRNDVNDATHMGVNNKYYLGVHTRHVWSFDRWVITDQDFSELTPITKNQPDAVASLNDIAKTAEVHRQAVKAIDNTDGSSLFIGQMAYQNAKTNAEKLGEHNLSNELNDLCAEFGCPPGADRMAWLRGQLRIAKAVRLLEAELISQRNR